MFYIVEAPALLSLFLFITSLQKGKSRAATTLCGIVICLSIANHFIDESMGKTDWYFLIFVFALCQFLLLSMQFILAAERNPGRNDLPEEFDRRL